MLIHSIHIALKVWVFLVFCRFVNTQRLHFAPNSPIKTSQWSLAIRVRSIMKKTLCWNMNWMKLIWRWRKHTYDVKKAYIFSVLGNPPNRKKQAEEYLHTGSILQRSWLCLVWVNSVQNEQCWKKAKNYETYNRFESSFNILYNTGRFSNWTPYIPRALLYKSP